MTIRKITGATSSVVVSATTTQFGIVKAHVTQPSLINKISNATARLIPKAHLASTALINRLLYDPDGFGTRSFFDYIFLGEKPSFYTGKRLDDSFSFLDSVILSIVKNREPSDTVNSDEAIAFLIKAARTFDDSSQPIDRPFLFLSRGAIQDTQNILEFVSIVRVKNFNETIASNEELTRLITAKRTFDDSVGMVDNFTFIDGSTYSLNRLIGEFVTIGSETDIRTSGSAKENISFFIDKVLDPDMELLSHISFYNDKGVKDFQDLLDLKALEFRTGFSDTFNSTSKTLLEPRKQTFDSQDLSDLSIRSIYKLLSDTTLMLDNFDLGDEFLFDYVKRFTELLPTLDLPQLSLDKVVFDSQSFNDFVQSFVDKSNRSNVGTTEDLSTFFGKVNNDTLSFLENIFIVRGRQFLDAILPTESSEFLVSKLLQDTVTADDPLVRLTDGINYYSIISKQETQPVIDDFTRIVEFYRYPHHGFLSPVIPQERDFKFVSLIAKAGALNQVPILRTNRLAWSEQFEQNYWEKSGVNVITNAISPPSNVIVSSDPTYDANQLQENFYNQPLNPYGTNWFQLTPLLNEISSDADLITTTSSDSAHAITSPSILEFFDGQIFAFSVYAKYAGTKYIRLVAGQDTTFAIFDIQNGSVVERSAPDVKASIQPVGNGFYLCEFGHTISTYGASPELQEAQRFFWNQTNGLYSTYEYILVPATISQSVKINLLSDSLEERFLGNGVSGAYIWGAQLETGEQVEQEVSSLNYIRTAGGPRSKLNYRIMPNDSDRVYVGTMLRDGTTLRVSGDQYENFSFILQETIFPETERAFPIDTFARSVRQSIGPNLNGYTSLAVSVTIGRPDLKRIAGDPQELIAFWFNKDVKKGGTSTAFSYKTIRTNLIRWSERFDYDYWTKINTRATTGISLMAGALPYRNVSLDANQVYGIFHDKEYTYQKYRWWDAVPLNNKPNFTSNAVVDLYESSDLAPHQIQTFGFATNLSGDFFASSIYASNANGVDRFRLQVGTVYADFNLSSQTVITSSGTLYTNISVIDAASKWYLCQIVGPTVALGLFNFQDGATVTELIQLLQPFFAGNEILTANDLRIPLYVDKGNKDTQPIADEKLGNFIKKEFSETRSIARNKTVDALRVAGVSLYKTTSSSVDLARYTPLSTEDSIYYRANEWWSELPNYTRARFAIGNAGTGPNMIDNMSLGDDFTYSGQITLNSDDNFVTLISRPNAILNKQPSIVDNLVTIGGTSGFRRQPTESSSETTKFDFNLNFYENRSIPQIPQYDAEMIAGLFYNTRQDIDGTQYTPVNGSYVYRKKTDWYNLVTRFARPRIAFGPGDRRGPVTFDNFQIADGFTYAGTIRLNSDDNFTSPVESISKNFILAAKHGVYSDLYFGYRADTTEEALRLMEIDAKPVKEWYQLAPYYDDYNHLKATPWDRDFVRVGSQGGSLRHQSWGLENILYFFDKGLSDTTTMIDNMELGDDLTYDQQKLLQDLVIAGSPVGFNIKDDKENVSFVTQLRAKRGGERSILTFDISNNTETDAELTAETQSIYPDDWFKLAPYYDTYVNLINEPTDALDPVRVGSQTSGKRTNADPFEKVSFFLLPKPLSSTQTFESRKGDYVIKELSETRMIPQNPRFDASRVMGLDLVNKTTSTINLTQYTPISGSTTYYAANDWYSEVPKFNRARFAIGNAGIGPQMLDSFSFGDNLTYYGDKDVDSFVYLFGDDGFRKQTGESTSETTTFFINVSAKHGVFSDLYIKRDRGLKDFVSQTTHAENWFQLAPYYDDYDHILNTPQDTDFITVGNPRLGKKHVGWPLEIVELLSDKGLSSNVTITTTSRETTSVVLKSARRSGYNSSTLYTTVRTNYITESEKFSSAVWEEVDVSVTNPVRLMNTSYTYRNTILDAHQIFGNFYGTSNNSSAYTYYNNYYGRSWYAETALTRQPTFTSNVVHNIAESDILGPHYIETTAFVPTIDTPANFFTYSLYVEKNTARIIRLAVDATFADFDLSSVSVVSSNQVIFSSIKAHNTASGIYLCQFIGYTNPIRRLNFKLFPADGINIDENNQLITNYKRRLEEIATSDESIFNSSVEDLQLLSGEFDLGLLSDEVDLTLP